MNITPPLITVDALRPEDYAAWLRLAQGYKTFYETSLPESAYQHTWQRLLQAQAVHGLAARVNRQLVGIMHYLFHASCWSADVCYLQDLFVAEAARGQGVARALIEQVAQRAREHGAPRLYWLTQHTNTRARRLYDHLATNQGFIRYDYPMV
ncbi:GNAT family N-acetyltransferase [Rhodoferax sp.]|uniref:GNAT family N-acetyltransferase n=1 Tax=Rhodoferax sp. TaxID=50421 RepID=UPI0026301567|nr:GNAT family N-acetyltransferase [Rhodoferax sp.]MDD2924166.1 GNAT family N-acetyltransferase [Rhodoferax sp.]